jgi:hypothetical protein
MKYVRQVPLKLVATSQVVAAEVYGQLDLTDLRIAELSWQADRPSSAEHGHWRWTDKIPNNGVGSNELYGLWHDNECQGLMELLMNRRSRSVDSLGEPIVYVNYIESAPWNQTACRTTLKYHGVGSMLVAFAMLLSRSAGYNGVVGLHSLTAPESFYTQVIGMTDLGIDASYYGLRYFEMSQVQATSYLQKRGLI